VGGVSRPTELELDGRVRAKLRRGTQHAAGKRGDGRQRAQNQCVWTEITVSTKYSYLCVEVACFYL
jgi:hypothetical protein